MPNRNITRDWDWLYDYDRRDYDQNDSERGFYDPYLYNRRDPRSTAWGVQRQRPYDNDSDFNNVRGRYSGYGPHGYQRSDERILDDVNELLTRNSQLDASDINVGVKDGVVTLTGSVEDRRDKRLAEDIADAVTGVWDVNNDLTVRNHRWNRGVQGASGNQVREGMNVIGRDGERIGIVKEVHADDFLVNRPDVSDLYVPFSACHVADNQVRLDVAATDLEAQSGRVHEKVTSRRNRE